MANFNQLHSNFITPTHYWLFSYISVLLHIFSTLGYLQKHLTILKTLTIFYVMKSHTSVKSSTGQLHHTHSWEFHHSQCLFQVLSKCKEQAARVSRWLLISTHSRLVYLHTRKCTSCRLAVTWTVLQLEEKNTKVIKIRITPFLCR